MSAAKVVIVDCAKAGLIGGPFIVLVVKGEKLVASHSGLANLEIAQARKEYLAAHYAQQVAA